MFGSSFLLYILVSLGLIDPSHLESSEAPGTGYSLSGDTGDGSVGEDGIRRCPSCTKY